MGEKIDFSYVELVEKFIEYKNEKSASELRDMQVYAGKSLYKEPQFLKKKASISNL